MSKTQISDLCESAMSSVHFKDLYDELHKITTSNISLHKYETDLKNIIESVIEYLIANDKVDTSIFELFCELNFINEFLYWINQNNRTISLQIIKSFSLWITNLTNKQSLYFWFSNNFINQIISGDIDKSDSDFLYYYVNFIKSLSLKIDETTIQFFLHKQMNAFPLLSNVLKWYNNPDQMINNVIRNIFLTIAKINYLPCIDYICSLPAWTYFSFISCRVRDMIKTLNKNVNNSDLSIISTLHDDIINDVLFFQDIYSLNIRRISFILTNCLFHYVILPLLCGSLIVYNKPPLSIYVALYIIIVFIRYIKDENFLNCLSLVLLGDKVHNKIYSWISNEPKSWSNYKSDWKSKEGGFNKFKSNLTNSWNKKFNWNIKQNENDVIINSNKENVPFVDYIMLNYTESWLRSMMFTNNSQFSEVQTWFKKVELKLKGSNIGILSTAPEWYKIILEELAGIVSKKETEIIRDYHCKLSSATGIQCGWSYKDNKQCFLYCFMKSLKSLNESKKEKKYINNPVKENIFSYWKSKDDSLILLSNILIYYLLNKSEYISKEVLSNIKLWKPEDINMNIVNNAVYVEDETQKLRDEWWRWNTNKVGIKIKKEKEKITFKTLHEKTLWKDFTIDTEILITTGTISPYIHDIQKEYSKDLVNNFIYLLSFEGMFRSITNSWMVHNIGELWLYNTNQDNTTYINCLNIPLTQGDILNQAFIANLATISKCLEIDKNIQQNCFEYFSLSLKLFNTKVENILNNILSQPYWWYPFNFYEKIEDYPNHLKPIKNDKDIFMSRLNTFFRVYHWLVIINKCGKLETPLDKVDTMQWGDYSTDVINSQSRDSYLNTELEETEVKIDDKYLHLRLCEKGRLDKYDISKLDSQVDRGEPRKLNVVYMNSAGIMVQIEIWFEDINKPWQIKKSIDMLRTEIKEWEWRAIKEYFGSVREQHTRLIKYSKTV